MKFFLSRMYIFLSFVLLLHYFVSANSQEPSFTPTLHPTPRPTKQPSFAPSLSGETTSPTVPQVFMNFTVSFSVFGVEAAQFNAFSTYGLTVKQSIENFVEGVTLDDMFVFPAVDPFASASADVTIDAARISCRLAFDVSGIYSDYTVAYDAISTGLLEDVSNNDFGDFFLSRAFTNDLGDLSTAAVDPFSFSIDPTGTATPTVSPTAAPSLYHPLNIIDYVGLGIGVMFLGILFVFLAFGVTAVGSDAYTGNYV
jgi:hypothetical protein